MEHPTTAKQPSPAQASIAPQPAAINGALVQLARLLARQAAQQWVEGQGEQSRSTKTNDQKGARS